MTVQAQAEPVTFATLIGALPFNATTQTGTGFFTPLWRASGHLTHLLAMLHEDDVDVEDGEAMAEINEAVNHLGHLVIPEGISTSARTQAEAIRTITTALGLEYLDWDLDTRKTNLRNAIQRYAGLIAFLDRELTGLTGSDPGTSF